ncbi:MAG: XkdF-like putative serine protease domain-containing protein [Candidatus Woesearchaeota archaeon]
MRIKELLLEDEMDIVDYISLVDRPAIKENWKYFSKDDKLIFSKLDNEKRVIIGPAMVPNKLIYRVDQLSGEEYYCWFKEDTIREISKEFIKNNFTHSTNLNHSEEIKDVYVFESWIIEDSEKDKSNHYGYKLKPGTWMVSMKVENDEIWEKVKNNEIRGFSIEGYFTDKLSQYSEYSEASIEKKINKILHSEDSDENKYKKIKNLLYKK